MFEAVAKMVVGVRGENLCLAVEAAKGGAIDDAVPVQRERAAERIGRL
jgi:hypothetical protein